MNRKIKAFTSTLLALSIVLSISACGNKKQTDAAKTLCETFCEDVKTGDADKLITYLGDSGVTSNDLKELVWPSEMNSEEAAFSAAIRESIRYNVQEPIYDYKAKTALVYISWGEADYNCEVAQASKTISEYKTALLSAPENIITTSVTVDLNGETPVIVNPKEVIDAVYAYNTEDHGIMPGLLSDFYLDGAFVLAPNGVYTNTDSIGVRINFDKELFSYRFIPGITYTVVRGEEALFASDVIYLEDNTIRLDFTADMSDGSCLNPDGFLIEGKYTFMIYDEHSNEIASFGCMVDNEEIEQETVEFVDHKKDYYLSNLVYEFKDSDLMGDTFVYNSGWWDYDGTSVGKSAFASNTKVLGFSLAVSPDNEAELYFEYYYSEESDFEGVTETDPVYTGSCYPSLYDDQACYDLDYPSTEFKPGFYGLVVYGDQAKKNIVFVAQCIVVEETSDDVIG